MEYVTLEPEWENVARYLANSLNHGENTAVVISFIEVIRYLTQTDIEAVGRILEELKR